MIQPSTEVITTLVRVSAGRSAIFTKETESILGIIPQKVGGCVVDGVDYYDYFITNEGITYSQYLSKALVNAGWMQP